MWMQRLAQFIGICVLAGGVCLSAQAKGVLKVCADPDYLPYSNKAGQGFENAVAQAVAKDMNRKLEYTWDSYRGPGGYSQFLSRTLDAGKCDVVMSLPYRSRWELTTDPYYVSSYVFIYKKGKGYDLQSMDSPVLKQVKVGFEAETPPQTGLMIRHMLLQSTPFHVGDERGVSPVSVLKAVQSGAVDVAITWEPSIGAFLPQYPDLEVTRVPNTRAHGSPEMYAFPISMAVRENDKSLEKELNEVISAHQSQLTDILQKHGVKLYSTSENIYGY